MNDYDLILAEAKHSTHIRNQEIEYIATSEEFLLYDDYGNADATIFTISYERSGVNRDGRPLLVAFNGGPGCASLLVHMGALGPQRVVMGNGVDMPFQKPYHMEENPDCILDICDLIMVDPVGTGYSRYLTEEAKRRYCDSKVDAKSVIMAIYQWIEKHERWNCPLLLFGESYGTVRSALIADQIFANKVGTQCNALNIHLDGLILVGSALDRDKSKFPIEPSVLNFSAVAAVHWYHHREGKPGLLDFLAQAEEFAYGAYLTALGLGSAMGKEREKDLIEQLKYFTGLSERVLRAVKFRVEASKYASLLIEDEKGLVSVYDGRFISAPLARFSDCRWEENDPCCERIMPAFTHCFHGMMKKHLNIETDRIYAVENMNMDDWDFNADKNPVHFLERAMQKNQSMKTMFVNGYYDMLTTYSYVTYLLHQFDLPADRVWQKGYESGHMAYIGADSAAALGTDLRNFVNWVCEEKRNGGK